MPTIRLPSTIAVQPPTDSAELGFVQGAAALLLRPVRLMRGYTRDALRADLIAGLTVGLVLLPQSLAFALLAGLPPQMGLYAAILAAIIGALWGSSSHLHTGPTNTASLLTLSVLLPLFAPGSPEFLVAAGLLAVMSGILRLLFGLARLGILVNFVSDSVAVGFTAGAGILIISNQIEPLMGMSIANNTNLLGTLSGMVQQISTAHLPTLTLGLGTIAAILVIRRLFQRLPHMLIGIVAATLIAWLLNAESYGVQTLGALPQQLPPFTPVPIFDLNLIGALANGALAIALIGLVEAVSIARAIAGHSHQRIDSNQEFVGQGLANIAAGLFSGYPCSGSFNRSALSYQSGAQTAFGNVVSGLFLLAAMFLLTPLMAHLPRTVLAGALVITAYSMIDRRTIVRIWRSTRGESLILLMTLSATLLLPLQFAVLIGVLMSLAIYIRRTSMPSVLPVTPTDDFRHWRYQPEKPVCPQLGVLSVLGDMYFGAVNHVEERIEANLHRNPEQRFLLLRMGSVQNCDMSGIRALEQVLRVYRQRGGDLFLVRVREPVLRLMRASGFEKMLGADHVLAQDTAMNHLFHQVLDPAICIYECPVRVFHECQALPKRILLHDQQAEHSSTTPVLAPMLTPTELWQQLHGPTPPLVVDVREPREFRQNHIAEAQLIPLPRILSGSFDLPQQRRIVLVCRSGQRSSVAATALVAAGFSDLMVLSGGMLAWEREHLLEAQG